MYIRSFALTVCAYSFIKYTGAQEPIAGVVKTCNKPGVFALTFDDGPSAYTPDLLRVLKEKNVTATFFVLGVQAAQSSLMAFLKQTFDAGHQIALHTNTHPHLDTLTQEAIKEEFTLNAQAVYNAIQVAPNYIRPPYGECSEPCQETIHKMGYSIINWNLDSNDWRYLEQPENHTRILSNIVDEVKASNINEQSFISLQHDTLEFSMKYVSDIIDAIKAKNYSFETVAECLNNQVPMYRGGGYDKPNSDNADIPYRADSIVNTNSFRSSVETNRFNIETFVAVMVIISFNLI
ncbi:hypothetical protein K7432_008602 [Basidiobolus ranarum]|uniref:NodB homology domain-containing protein n=1 Tax=Basidiobolus ranarum TaxID=34480 RepID=A0ABR2WRM0_9FUNG